MSNFASNGNMTEIMTAIGAKKDDKPTEISWSDYIALTDAQRAGKHYTITGFPGISPVDDYVEVTADGVKTRAQLLSELNALVNWNKITENSYIKFGNDIYRVTVPSVKIFMTSAISISTLYNTMFDLNNALSQQFAITSNGSTTFTDNSSNVPASGTKITLHYGL